MFSKRNGFASDTPIKFRHDAPQGFRYAVIQAAHDHLKYDSIRTCICRVLRVAPDLGSWTEVPNIRDEVLSLINDTEWYRVYDIVETLVAFIEGTRGYDFAEEFASSINDIFVDTGAGWQWKPSEGIVLRGDAQFEDSVQSALTTLIQSGFIVAENELKEALHDISRRPAPDLTGAIHHALGALEAAGRRVHNSNMSFSKIYDKIGIPKPLDTALEKMWGYSSNYGRHVSETHTPNLNDATLIVHLSSAFCRYLAESQKESS